MLSRIRFLALLLIPLFTGCGYKGPLYLPKDKPVAAKPAPQPAPAANPAVQP